MSDSQAFEERTISSEGVTVIKRFEEDEFPVPAIAFEFESDREEEVTIRLSDTVPESIAVEDLGFHPEYGSEYWTMDEEQITFERPLAPGAEYTTVYGIRATGSDNIDQFLTEPKLEEVDPPLPEPAEEGTNSESISDAVGDGELALPEEEVPEGADEDDIATLELNEPTLDEDESESATAASETDTTPPVEGESLVSALTAEITQGDVSKQELETLRNALGNTEDAGSTTARLDQLQRDITDLRAYTTALEDFLDENGTGAALLEEFDERLETVTGRVTEVEAELDSVTETVEQEVTGVKEDISRVETELSAVSEEVQTVDEQITRATDGIDSVESTAEEAVNSVDEISDELSSFETTVSELERQVETLESQVTEEDVGARVDDIAESVSDLQEWQEQLKKTFGGGD